MSRLVTSLLVALGLLCAVSYAGTCTSTGDTHVHTYGHGNFDIYSPNTFILVEHQENDKHRRFVVHANQAYGLWGSRTVDKDAAVRCGNDVVVMIQHRNNHPPTVKVNGRQHTLNHGQSFRLPSAPNSRYYLHALHYGHMFRYTLDCNHMGYESNYAFGHKVRFDWMRSSNWKYIHGNFYVEQQSRHAWTNSRGACGWIRGHPHPNSNPNHWFFISKASSLFALTPADHAKEAHAGRKVSDPAHLKNMAARCARAVYTATGVSLTKVHAWFKRLDKNVVSAIEGFIRGCSIDAYYGLEPKTEEMGTEVCGWVKLARDDVFQDVVRMKRRIANCAQKPWVKPTALLPLLIEQHELAQFCNKNPPKNKVSLPTGVGFNPTCEVLERRKEAALKAKQEQAEKAKEANEKAEKAKEQAAKEDEAKALERKKLEEEEKKIEKEREEAAKLKEKADEEEQKRLQARKSGVKEPKEKAEGPKPGSTMVQKSKVLVWDAGESSSAEAADPAQFAESGELEGDSETGAAAAGDDEEEETSSLSDGDGDDEEADEEADEDAAQQTSE